MSFRPAPAKSMVAGMAEQADQQDRLQVAGARHSSNAMALDNRESDEKGPRARRMVLSPACPRRFGYKFYWRMALFSAAATLRFTERKLSGLTEIESMPHSTRNSANSG